ncbi:MAG: phage Tail Collar domain protein [Thermoleophilia bacterium]|nr:phage Tail Collar domain protein [Thermoleophilia bacterium]
MTVRHLRRPSYANLMATLALVIAACGAGIPQATAAAVRTAFATNAGAVDGVSASRTPKAKQLLPLNAAKRFPASVLDLSGVYDKAAADARFVPKGTALDATTLDGLDSAAFRKSVDAVDAATLGGRAASSFLGASATAVDADKLDGLDSTAFRRTIDAVDASTLGGRAASTFLGATSKAVDANLLDGVDSAQLVRTTTAFSSSAAAVADDFAGLERFRPVAVLTRGGSTSSGGSSGRSCYIGEVALFAFNFEPVGWAHAHGQILPIAQNTALFSLLGTTYGGNGQTTFALPDTFGLAPAGMVYDICMSGIFPAQH